MSKSRERPRRSGCAVVMGVFLIALGGLFLASNLFGFSLLRFWTQALLGFSTYWPVLLILWGAYKLYQRVSYPETARVGAGEIFFMIVLVLVGLAFAFTRKAIEEASGDVSWNELIEDMGPEFAGPAHRFSEEQRFEYRPGVPLRIVNPRGSVTVEGWDGPRVEVSLVKRLNHVSAERAEELAAEVALSFDETEEGALLRITRDSRSNGSPEIRTHLELKVPKTVPISVENHRGPIRVLRMESGATLTSTDDAIEVRDARGNFSLETRRGPVRLERVEGDVRVLNHRGSINARSVTGAVTAETSNGAIVLQEIGGKVRLKNRHARIRAIDLDGDLAIEATHTEISVERAASAVEISTTHRPVFVRDVQGTVRVEARNAAIDLREVAGDVEVTSRYRRITVTEVKGGLRVNGSQSRVRVERIRGPIQIESSYEPVEVRDFGSSLKIASRHAPLTVTTEELTADWNLRTSYGDVSLQLPEDASFRLNARTKDGEFRSSFSDDGWVRTSDDEGEHWQGAVGGGSFPLVVETSYGDISLSGSEVAP